MSAHSEADHDHLMAVPMGADHRRCSHSMIGRLVPLGVGRQIRLAAVADRGHQRRGDRGLARKDGSLDQMVFLGAAGTHPMVAD
jgi:hypothetical protein